MGATRRKVITDSAALTAAMELLSGVYCIEVGDRLRSRTAMVH